MSADVTSYEDKTLDKVRAGIREADPFLDEQLLTDMIAGIQNQGILFRERQPEADVVHAHGTHGWHLHTADEHRRHQRPIDDEQGPYPVMGGHPAQLTDGFHTMEELYDHRRALTAALFAERADISWRSKAHHPDDSPMFEGGYFVVGIDLPFGATITYHYKLSHWDDFAGVPELPHAPKWDGATPADTVTRLLDWARDEPVPAAMTAPAADLIGKMGLNRSGEITPLPGDLSCGYINGFMRELGDSARTQCCLPSGGHDVHVNIYGVEI